MIDRGRGVLALRALRLKAGRRGENRKLLDAVLGDEDKRAILAAALEDEYGPATILAEGDAPASETPIRDFIDFILERQDAIIEFIKQIIALFSS